MFTRTNTTLITKKGAVRTTSRRVSGRHHQVIPKRSTGKTATDALLSIANTNAARLRQYRRSAASEKERDGTCTRDSAFRYHRIDKRKNSIASRFFRCVIQATDSTLTGCTAN